MGYSSPDDYEYENSNCGGYSYRMYTPSPRYPTTQRRLDRRREKHDIEEICRNHSSKKTFDNVPIRKLLVANISQKTTHKALKESFVQFGKVDDCILKRREPDKKNYAFVTFKENNIANKVLQQCYRQQIMIDGQYLRVVPAASWHQPDHAQIDKESLKSSGFEFSGNQGDIVTDDVLEKLSSLNINNYALEKESLIECPIHNLNNDCLMHIFSYFSYNQRFLLEKVCVRWQAVMLDLWKLERKISVSSKKFGRRVDAPFLYNVVSRCNSHLLHIDLSNCGAIKNATLIAIAKLCPNLRSMNIKGLKFTPSGIKALAKNVRNLTYLQIKAGICDDELAALIGNNRNLQKLEIEYPADVRWGGKFLSRLSLKSIEEVTLITPPYSMKKDFCETITRVKNLRSIKMRGNSFAANGDGAALGAIGVCAHSLQTFEFSLVKRLGPVPPSYRPSHISSSQNLEIIYQYKNLHSIILRDNEFIQDDFLIKLANNCLKLSEVDITGCAAVTDRCVKSIASLPKLERLLMNNLKNVTDEALANMPNLKVLHCRECPNIHHVGLISLMTVAGKLEEIDVYGNKLITTEFIDAAAEISEARNGKVLRLIVGQSLFGASAEFEGKKKFLKILNGLYL